MGGFEYPPPCCPSNQPRTSAVKDSPRLVVLPQAIGKVIPPLTNTVVVIVKNTSLVLVIGLFDLLSSGRAALADPTWPAPYAESYLLVALIYFIICFGISRYALWLEQNSSFGARR
jgi:general L-amino acid transport system permease protein